MSHSGTVLVVESGCHGGIRKAVPGGETTVGGGLGDDIVLFGDCLEAGHLVLSGEGGRRSPFAIRANAPAIVNGAPIGPGETRPVALPATVEANGVRLSWQAANAGAGLVPARLGLVALALVAGALLAWSVPEAAAPIATIAAAAPEPAPEPAAPAPGTGTAASELTRLVREAGLGVSIAGGPQQVTARGTISPDDEGAWRRVQVAFDARFGTTVPLVNLVRVETPVPPSLPPIEAVWQGDGPYVVVRGRKYHVGAAIGGEWQVTGIRADAVTLRHAAAGEVIIEF